MGGKPERRIEQNTVSASFCYLSSSEIMGMRQQICDASSPLYGKQVESSREATRSSFFFGDEK
jgi:hypothetical protein